MAEKAHHKEEEEARRREEARIADLESARMRSEKAGALVRTCDHQGVDAAESPSSGTKDREKQPDNEEKQEGTKDDAEDEEDAKAEEDADEEENAEEKVPATENQGKKQRARLLGKSRGEFARVHGENASEDSYQGRHTHRSAQRYASLSSSIQGPAVPLVPSELQPFQRKFICTHGWSERERSTGKRTSHTLRRAECPFQMLAQLAKKADGSWGVMMRREIYQHKHLISEDIYRYYPGIRQVSDDSPLLPGVEVLPEAKAGTTSIYDYIRSNSNHRVTMDDVRNLIARLKPK
ncbi:hypothetical protein F442_17986, partial [Phytophthora nicotianae P10297]